jgi:hypothetical protein
MSTRRPAGSAPAWRSAERAQPVDVGTPQATVVTDHGVDAADGLGHVIDLVDQGKGGHLVRHGDGKAAVVHRAGAGKSLGQPRRFHIVSDIDQGQIQGFKRGVVQSGPHRMVGGKPEQSANPEAGVDATHEECRFFIARLTPDRRARRTRNSV